MTNSTINSRWMSEPVLVWTDLSWWLDFLLGTSKGGFLEYIWKRNLKFVITCFKILLQYYRFTCTTAAFSYSKIIVKAKYDSNVIRERRSACNNSTRI